MEDTLVCTVWQCDRLEQIASHQVFPALWPACATIGSACLGFKAHEISTHSLQSGAVMEMYLAGIPVYTIMLIGRWSSDAFLHNIRKQGEQFSKYVAKQMLTFWLFRTIPDIARCVVSKDNPRQCNHGDNAKTRCNIGCNKSQQVQLPAFSLSNWSINNAEAINGGGIISPIAGGIRRGESWNNFQFQTQPPCTHLVHLLLIHVLGRHLALKLLHWMDTDRGGRGQGL